MKQKRILAFMLSLVMILSILPTNIAFSAENELECTITANDVTYGEPLDITYSGLDGFTLDEDYQLQYSVADKDEFSNTVPTNAGDYDVKAVLMGETANSYTINESTVQFKIMPKELELRKNSNNPTISKTYDGNKSATVTYAYADEANADEANIIISGILDGDTTPTLTYTAMYNDRNCMEAETVTVSNFGLSGEGSDNYTVESAEPLKFTAEIIENILTFPAPSLDNVEVGTPILGIQIPLTATGINNEKFPGHAVITSSDKGKVEAETTYSGLAWEFVADEAPATPITNYSNYYHTGNNATVSGGPKIELTPTLTVEDKEYDGRYAVATVSGMGDLVEGTDYKILYTKIGYGQTMLTAKSSGTFEAEIKLKGNAEKNYVIVGENYKKTFTISPKVLTVNNIDGLTKQYDGTTTVPATLTNDALMSAISGYGDGETDGIFSVISFKAEYNSNGVDATKIIITDINVNNPAIDANYTIPERVEMPATITPIALTAAWNNDVVKKTYDGKTDVDVTDKITLTGALEGETPTLATCIAQYMDKNVGTGINVRAEDVKLDSNNPVNKNYTLNSGAIPMDGEITPAMLRIDTPPRATNVEIGRPIEGYTIITTATGVNGETFTGMARITDTDRGTVAAEQEYDNLNWMFTVLLQGYNRKSNYSNADTLTGNNGYIKGKAKELKTAVLEIEDKIYDGTAVSPKTATVEGLTEGTEFEVQYSADNNTWSDTAPTNAGTYSAKIVLKGTANDKYKVAMTSDTFTISKVKVKLVYSDEISKSYDGDTNAAVDASKLALKNAVDGNDVTGVGIVFDGGVNASYASKNAGENIVVTVSNAQLRENNGDAVNYEFTENGTKLTGKITKANVTVKIKDVSKTYGTDYTNYINYEIDFTEDGNGGIASESVRAEILGEIKELITSYTCDGLANTAVVKDGGYEIVPTLGSTETDNVKFTVQKGILTVNKAPLTIKVKDVSRKYGEKNPTLEAEYTGFVNGETKDVLKGELVLAYDASINTETSCGTYIGKTTVSGVTADNYDITFKSGNVEITKIPITATAGTSRASYLAVKFDKTVEGITAENFTVKNGETPVAITGVTVSDDNMSCVLSGAFTVDTEYTVEIGYENDKHKVTEGTTLTITPKKSSGGGNVSSTPVSYTVTFDTDGGSKVASVNVTKNNTVTEPTVPTKDGYVFDGWYTDKKLIREYDFDTNVNYNCKNGVK